MRYLRLLMSCAGTLAIMLSGAACAQGTGDYPSLKPVTMIIPSNPGGPSDFEVRLYAPVMAALMGQQFIVDYKFGAGSIIGTSYVAKAAPDGYTLLMTTSSFTATPAVQKNLPFDIIKDFAPVSLVSQKPLVLMVRANFPAKTFQEYI